MHWDSTANTNRVLASARAFALRANVHLCWHWRGGLRGGEMRSRATGWCLLCCRQVVAAPPAGAAADGAARTTSGLGQKSVDVATAGLHSKTASWPVSARRLGDCSTAACSSSLVQPQRLQTPSPAARCQHAQRRSSVRRPPASAAPRAQLSRATERQRSRDRERSRDRQAESAGRRQQGPQQQCHARLKLLGS